MRMQTVFFFNVRFPPFFFSFSFLRLITVFDTLMMTSAIELDTLIGQGFEKHRRPF